MLHSEHMRVASIMSLSANHIVRATAQIHCIFCGDTLLRTVYRDQMIAGEFGHCFFFILSFFENKIFGSWFSIPQLLPVPLTSSMYRTPPLFSFFRKQLKKKKQKENRFFFFFQKKNQTAQNTHTQNHKSHIGCHFVKGDCTFVSQPPRPK